MSIYCFVLNTEKKERFEIHKNLHKLKSKVQLKKDYEKSLQVIISNSKKMIYFGRVSSSNHYINDTLNNKFYLSAKLFKRCKR